MLPLVDELRPRDEELPLPLIVPRPLDEPPVLSCSPRFEVELEPPIGAIELFTVVPRSVAALLREEPVFLPVVPVEEPLVCTPRPREPAPSRRIEP